MIQSLKRSLRRVSPDPVRSLGLQAYDISAQNRSKSIPDLPWDIICIILSFLPLESIPQVVTTCRSFCRAGQLRLYRHIRLAGQPIRSLYLFRTLLTSPHLAGYVRTFDVPRSLKSFTRKDRMVHRLLKVDVPDTRWAGQYVLGAEAVSRKLTAVEYVYIPGAIDGIKLQHRRLKRVRIDQVSGIDYFTVFRSLPNVTHFEVLCASNGLVDMFDLTRIKPKHMPQLRELVASHSLVKALVPGRPVERLSIILPWTYRAPDPYELLTAVSRGTGKIKMLCLVIQAGFQQMAADLLDAVGQFLSDIEELHIRLPYSWWPANNHDIPTLLISVSSAVL